MMSMKVDWERLKKAHAGLVESGLSDEADVTFLMILADGKPRKSTVKFKNFLAFFWHLSESTAIEVKTLIVQDAETRVLYRHKQKTPHNEEIPEGGNVYVLQNWSTLSQEQRDTYIKLTIAQIQSYDKPST